MNAFFKRLLWALVLLFGPGLKAQNYTEPSLSPDGTTLLFTFESGGDQDIYLADADGSNIRRVAGFPGWDVHPRWSPDGRFILFNNFPKESDAPHDVYTVRPDGSGLANLTRDKFHDGQANDWSPDGKRVLISSGKYPGINLFVLNADGSGARKLTNEPDKVCYYASFSPDGKKILFTGYTQPERDVFIMDAAGKSRRKLYAGGDAPVWSPDGRKILFQVKEGDHFFLHWMNADGSEAGPVLDRRIEGSSPSWSPDGRTIWYDTKNAAGLDEIRALDLATGAIRTVLPQPHEPERAARAICRHIEVLAGDDFQGRKPGTPGETKTLNYLRDQFEQAGLRPGNGDSYFQEVRLARFSTVAPANIALKGNGLTDNWQLHKDFLLASSRTAETVRVADAPLVFAGFGIHAPEIGWDDYAGLDVRGKIVVVLGQSPDQYGAGPDRWRGDPAANLYGQSFYKRNEAAARGAVGLLTIYRDSPQGIYTWGGMAAGYGQSGFLVKKSDTEPQLDFWGLVHPEAARRLFEQAGWKDFDWATEALLPGFRSRDLSVSARFSFSNAWTDLTTYNVVALLPGTDRADEAILYTAHWDHVGTGAGPAGDTIFNGAVDNASGTAALLEIARAWKSLPKPPRRSILFIATAAEEMGLLGSVWYAAHPLFPLGKTAAAFNMDAHFPYGKTKYVTGVVYGRSGLDPFLEEAARRQGRMLVPNTEDNIANNIFFRSDHFPLAEAGIPSEFAVGAVGQADSAGWMQKVMAYMGRYHQVTDEYSPDFDCSGIWQDAELVFLAGRLLDSTAAFPVWHADQPFQRPRLQALSAVQAPAVENAGQARADEAAIRANFAEQAGSWNRGDIDGYMKAYWKSDSIRTISRAGVTYGYEPIRQNYLRYFPPGKMGQLHFDEMTLTRLNEAFYYVVGRFNLTYPDRAEPVQGWFSVLMQKIDGKWWMVSDHSG